ncbi:MAG: substrate-binding domain-containing protein, partial [Cellulomonas sp.]
AALVSPALTSVGIPLVACGRAGVDLLVARIHHPETPATHHHDLSFQLVVRDSTGPARAALRDTA